MKILNKILPLFFFINVSLVTLVFPVGDEIDTDALLALLSDEGERGTVEGENDGNDDGDGEEDALLRIMRGDEEPREGRGSTDDSFTASVVAKWNQLPPDQRGAILTASKFISGVIVGILLKGWFSSGAITPQNPSIAPPTSNPGAALPMAVAPTEKGAGALVAIAARLMGLG